MVLNVTNHKKKGIVHLSGVGAFNHRLFNPHLFCFFSIVLDFLSMYHPFLTCKNLSNALSRAHTQYCVALQHCAACQDCIQRNQGPLFLTGI